MLLSLLVLRMMRAAYFIKLLCRCEAAEWSIFVQNPTLPPCPKSGIALNERSVLSLAYVGDGVLDLLVRSRLVAQSRLPVGALHKQAVRIVSARAQFAALCLLEPLLSEAEQAVVRRGRNSNKATASKNASTQEYRASTGLEALLGWLYLQGDMARIQTLFEVMWEHYLEEIKGSKPL